MPREINLRVEALRKQRKLTSAKLATRLGVTETTLRAYRQNTWTVLDRNVLEGFADIFRCEAASLLETRESPFFDPFRSHPSCLFLRRPDAHVERYGQKVAHRDYGAIRLMEELLGRWVEGIVPKEAWPTEPEQFDELLGENCIVVGSPVVNPAAEMALCLAFEAMPFAKSQGAKLPFTFRVAGRPSMPASSIVEESPSGELGIWLPQEETLIEADYWPFEEFKPRSIDKGRDCAVILVGNQGPADPPGSRRKLVALSGFTGAGTEAAATAVVEHYRDLEPRDGLPFVWGIIEVFYQKDEDSVSRTILGYNWRYRVGGRCPIDLIRRNA
jgi:transcriptional regulator with XRE-family HTH domain